MPSLSLSNTLKASGGLGSSYIKDGLKLYMPYSSPKEVKFVGQGSTAFDGSYDFIDCGHDATLDVGTSDFTACAWFKVVNDGNNHDIISKGASLDTGYGWSIAFVESSQRMYFDTGDGTTRQGINTASDTIQYNKWHHVAATRSNSTNTLKLYIDGEFAVERTDASNNDLGDGSQSIPFEIGSSANNRYLNGSVKNVGFWNRVLSHAEIQNVMYKTYVELNSYSGTLIQGLVSWWPLSEGVPGWLGSAALDNHGTNHGIGTSMNSDNMTNSLYGGATPLIPRGVDNAPVVQADAIGTGYATFNGSSDYINVGSSIQSTFNNSFTLMAWIKSDVGDPSTTADTIMGTINSSGEDNIYLRLTTDQKIELIYFGNNDSVSSKTTAAVFAAGETEWTHVSVTMTNPNTGSSTIGNDQILFYINGVLTASSAGAGGADDISEANFEAYSSSDDFAIGARNDANDGAADDFWDGKLKNVSVWSSALTQAQIQSIMEKTYSELTSSEKTNLVSWWGLDSGVGEGLTHVADEHNESLGSELIVNANLGAGGAGAPTFNDDKSVIIFSADSNTDSSLSHATIIPVGKVYKFSYTVDSYTSGGLAIWETVPGAGSDSARTLDLTVGDHFIYLNGRSASSGLFLLDDLGGGDDDIFTLSNLSVKEVLGNYGVLL